MNRAEYEIYLNSDKWRDLVRKIRARSNNKCEICLINPHEHTHHKTYNRIGRELLTDLVGICQRCHRAVHLRPQEDGKILTVAEFEKIIRDCRAEADKKDLQNIKEFIAEVELFIKSLEEDQ